MPYSVPCIVASYTPLEVGKVHESFNEALQRDVKYLIIREATYDEWKIAKQEDNDWTPEKDQAARESSAYFYAIVAD